MYKYFISFWAENNGIGLQDDIFEFDYELNSKENIKMAHEEIAWKWFGDSRKIVIISFQKV